MSLKAELKAERAGGFLSEPEEKPSKPAGNSPVAIGVFSFVLVSLAIALYVYLGEKPPVATGEISSMQVVPIHRVTPNYSSGTVGDASVFDEMVVVAEVKLHNQSTGPLFVRDFWGTLKLDPTTDGQSFGATKTDLTRAYLAYPMIPRVAVPPIERDSTIAPGATVDGMMLFNYPVSKEVWDKRESLNIVISFTHQMSLTLRAPK